ncbi:Meiotically up-regulated protein 154 [Ceratocystis lukuohia]|uniref:Meiotically up-regulated protein 154 n=1 Tax=Ceratocystis lukuohia TaxID=2019550 RepID=A0ABR4M8N8_9PEZI
MAPPPRRIVRKKPLSERLSAVLNPMDFLLWLSEEMETREYDPETLGLKLGLAMHVVFLLARSNSASEDVDDLFGDGGSSSSMAYLSRALVWTLVLGCLVNAYYTTTRVRLYRLFQHNIDAVPDTKSAKRVNVQSTPSAASPIRLFKHALRPESAEDRSHPDKTRDVWELAVWDPLPLSLRIACIFSPAHALVYLTFLPISRDDPQPSITVLNCLVLQTVLSLQLLLVQSCFAQQAKDTALVNREVMNEYNTKFVHPRLHPTVRDAATQANITETGNNTLRIEMSSAIGTPTTLLHRGFQIHPNTNYSKAYDPEGYNTSFGHSNSPQVYTPTPASRPIQSIESPTPALRGSLRESMPAMMVSHGTSTGANVLKSRTSMGTMSGSGSESYNFGGNMGVHTHTNSPLKKATSMGDMSHSPQNSREMAALEQQQQRGRLYAGTNPFAESRGKPYSSKPAHSASQLGRDAVSRSQRQY